MARFSTEDWIEDNLQNVKHSGGGDEREATCPGCGKFGSFYVNAAPANHVCFASALKGRGLANLIAETEGISRIEARRRMMEGIVEFKRVEPATLTQRIAALRGFEDDDDEPKLDVEVPLPPEFISVYNEKSDKWRFPAYLSRRGMTRETALKFNMGFCRSGDYRQRVVFPIVCPNGYSFTARDITGHQIPRYRNPEGAGLGRLLFGWNTLKDNQDFLVVEGPMDAIMANQAGFPSIALCGKSFGKEQAAMLAARVLGAAIVMLDPEEGAAPVDTAMKLLAITESVYIAELPEGKDPGSATPEQITAAYDEAERFKGKRSKRALGALKDSRRKLEKRFAQEK